MKRYQIDLSEDELIVLSDWLYRFLDNPAQNFKDPAEQLVLWGLDCQLEKLNEHIFSQNYDATLHEAYERIRDD